MHALLKRAAIYARVSRADQRSALQRDEAFELIHRRGWELVETFGDDGASGASSARPQLRELLEAAKRRRFDVLVVWRTDRLFRSLRELLNTLAELDALGVGFVSVTEPFDSTTPTGRLMMQIVGAFAEFERQAMIERTRAGMAAARARGARIGRPRRELDLDRARALRANSTTWEAISRELGVGQRTIRRALSGQKGG